MCVCVFSFSFFLLFKALTISSGKNSTTRRTSTEQSLWEECNIYGEILRKEEVLHRRVKTFMYYCLTIVKVCVNCLFAVLSS